MKKSICIICKGEKKGDRVEDDIYIGTMRKIKNRLNIATNNTLVVCKDCTKKAEEKRRRFERTMMTWGILSALIFVMFILMSPTLLSFFLSFVAIAFFMLIGLLTSYFPKVEKHGGKKGRTGSRKGAEART